MDRLHQSAVPMARLHLSEGAVASEASLPAVQAELMSANLYPDPDCSDLIAAIANRWDIAAARIAVGNGSDELLLICALALGDMTRPGLVSAGTFRGHRYALEVARRPICEIPLARDRVDVAALVDAIPSAGIAFVCTPHNPSGTALSYEELDAVATAATRSGTTVVFDEAYMEFAPSGIPSAISRASSGIVALRTFSKAYGLAGMRIGYAVASHDDAAAMRHAQRVLPFRANRLGQAAALAALTDRDCLRRVKERNTAKREWFINALTQAGFTGPPSAANFITVRVPDPAAVARRLREHHQVLVRDTTDMGYPGHIRISLGSRPELDRALAGLIDAHNHLAQT